MKKVSIIFCTVLCSTLYAPMDVSSTSRPTDAGKQPSQPSEMVNVSEGQQYIQQLQQRGGQALKKPVEVPEETQTTPVSTLQAPSETETGFTFAPGWEEAAQQLQLKTAPPSLVGLYKG